ncbi:MAG: deoxynucleoside kinase [Myxococcales bacterium]|nr:deoxynucleoside kinase [Myxococcales bacterium]USN49832.1 MAG: deoxynucleoside kinase [Myxococcales bacterium]
MSKERKYIAVAGNMGVGKSTLVQFLTAQFGGEPFYEPVDTNPYFARFFRDMKRWSFHSQIYFLTHKFRIHQQVEKKSGLIVVDRSIYEDAEIFARGLYKAQKMTKSEFELYWSLFDAMCTSLRPPDVLVYLKCDISTLKERIAKRGRKEEKSVPDAHLRLLQRRYDDWVKRINFCEVITIKNDNLDYIGDQVHQAHVIERLSKYL